MVRRRVGCGSRLAPKDDWVRPFDAQLAVGDCVLPGLGQTAPDVVLSLSLASLLASARNGRMRNERRRASLVELHGAGETSPFPRR
jgi:hypothetical protein